MVKAPLTFTDWLESHPEALHLLNSKVPASLSLSLIQAIVRDENRLRVLS